MTLKDFAYNTPEPKIMKIQQDFVNLIFSVFLYISIFITQVWRSRTRIETQVRYNFVLWGYV